MTGQDTLGPEPEPDAVAAPGLRQLASIAGWAFAALWITSVVLTGLAIEGRVEPIPEVLRTISNHRAMFIAANVVEIASQLVLPVFLLGLVIESGRRPLAALGVAVWALAIPVFVMSATFHIIMTHVPARHAARRWPVSDAVVDDADILHHLADFSLWVGLVMVAIALTALWFDLPQQAARRRVVRLAIPVTVASILLQFLGAVGLPVFDVFAIVASIGLPVTVVALSPRRRR